jgi:hypothetical protein
MRHQEEKSVQSLLKEQGKEDRTNDIRNREPSNTKPSKLSFRGVKIINFGSVSGVKYKLNMRRRLIG